MNSGNAFRANKTTILCKQKWLSAQFDLLGSFCRTSEKFQTKNPKPSTSCCMPGAARARRHPCCSCWSCREAPSGCSGYRAQHSCCGRDWREEGQSIFRNTVSPHIAATLSVSAECESRVFHATECGDFFLLLNMLFLETFLIVVMGLFPMGQHFQLRPLYK